MKIDIKKLAVSFYLMSWVAVSLLITSPVRGFLFLVLSCGLLLFGSLFLSMVVSLLVPRNLIKDKNARFVIILTVTMLVSLLSIFLLVWFFDRKLLIPFGMISIFWIVVSVDKLMAKPVHPNK